MAVPATAPGISRKVKKVCGGTFHSINKGDYRSSHCWLEILAPGSPDLLCTGQHRVPPYRQILDTRTDTPDLRACLESLSDLYPENTPAARRGLRSTIDNSGLEAATAFLAGLEGVLGALDAVHAGLDGLGLACRAAQDTLAATRASSAGLLAEHRGLRHQLEAARQRSVSLALFLQEYQLSPAEQAVLTQVGD